MGVLHTPHPMRFASHLPAPRHARRALLCLLLLGLLLQGPAQVLRHLVGAAHWHAAVPVPHTATSGPAQRAGWDHGLVEVRHLRQQLQARSPLAGGHAVRGHRHDGTERHHHHPADATVVALEPLHDREAMQSDGASASLLQPLGLADALAWRLPPAAAPRWPAAMDRDWRNADLRQPERPPRA